MSDPADEPAPTLRVATWNVYLGADLVPIIAARDPRALGEASLAVIRQAERTRFAERAEVIAATIAAARPDVIGLQEVGHWRITRDGRREELWNHLRLVLSALEDLGEKYVSLFCSETFTGALPLDDERTVEFTNCDAMLLRVASEREITVLDAGEGHYGSTTRVELANGETLQVRRGWVHADLEVDGRRLRVVTTHLDSIDPEVRRNQAHELVTVASPSPYPTVLVGDFNPQPDDRVIDVVTGAGYVDAWDAEVYGPGPTWGRTPDLDTEDDLTERLDYVFLDPKHLYATHVGLIGADVSARTAKDPQVWASDHAGVLAEIARH